MARRFITATLDSKLVPFEHFLDGPKEVHLLNLRMHVVAAVLLRQQIVIPQGWTLDSLPVFAVMSEVSDACCKLNKSGGRTPNTPLDRSLFIRESHVSEKSYPELLATYLRRPDCHWSGIPIFRESPATRLRLAESISKTLSERTLSREKFQELTAKALDDSGLPSQSQQVARCWSDVLGYFSKYEGVLKEDSNNGVDLDRRGCRITMPPRAYFGNVLLALAQISKVARTKTRDMASKLDRFNSEALRFQGTQPVSTILNMAEEHFSDSVECMDAIRHISTFSQIWSIADLVQADSIAPTLTKGHDLGRRFGNGLLVEAFSPIKRAPGITIRTNVPSKLHKNFGSVVWSGFWQRVISFAESSLWTEPLKETLASSERGETVAALRHFEKLQSALQSSLPEVCFKQSLTGRFVLQINPTVEAALASAWLPSLETAAAAEAASHLWGEIDVFSHHLLGLAGAAALLTAKLLNKSIDAHLNPFSERTASIFELQGGQRVIHKN